jgi:2-methylcitrate dehydratase PrpD
VIALAKTHVLDQLGVGLVAASLDRNRPLAALATAFGTGGYLTSLGFATPVTAAAAALRNGALMHSLEYDGTHTASITHAGSAVASVALAVCEETGASGANLLRAFILGWEMFVLLGLAAPRSFSKRGFRYRVGRTLCRCVHGGPAVRARGRGDDERAGHRRQPGKRCHGVRV